MTGKNEGGRRAVIYARYSSHNQREQSIEDQVRICEEEAAKEDDEVVAVYFDKAISGTTDRRPGFQAMIAASKDADWQRVWTYKIDRFARDRYDSAVYRHMLRKNGVEIKTAAEPIPDGPIGIVVEAIMEGLAEYYTANLSENVKRGKRGNALKCHHNGVARFGYDLADDGRYLINELEAKYVKQMYQLRARGWTFARIQAAMKARGCRYRNGREVRIQAIRRIIHSEAYKGVYTYTDVRIENGMPAIVSKRLWNSAQNPKLITDGCAKRPWNHDIKGQEFGYLVPVEIAGIDKNHHYKWLCECRACNGTKIEYATRLTSGLATDCGCLSGDGRKRDHGRFAQTHVF